MAAGRFNEVGEQDNNTGADSESEDAELRPVADVLNLDASQNAQYQASSNIFVASSPDNLRSTVSQTTDGENRPGT